MDIYTIIVIWFATLKSVRQHCPFKSVLNPYFSTPLPKQSHVISRNNPLFYPC